MEERGKNISDLLVKNETVIKKRNNDYLAMLNEKEYMERMTNQKQGVYEFFVRLGRQTKGVSNDCNSEIGKINFLDYTPQSICNMIKKDPNKHSKSKRSNLRIRIEQKKLKTKATMYSKN